MWRKHRATTRLLALSILFCYIYAVYTSASSSVVSTTGWIAFSSLLVLTFGLNSLDKLIELIKAWRK